MYPVDAWWLILIAYTGLSALWATNSGYAIYGMFTTLLLYCCYKIFEDIDWEDKRSTKVLTWLVVICLFVAILICTYAVKEVLVTFYQSNIVDSKFVILFDKNFHLLGALIVLLLPFALFNNFKYNKYTSSVLLMFSLLILYATGSAQVFIVLLFTSLIYVLYILSYTLGYKYPVLLGFLLVILFSIYQSSFFLSSSNKKSFVVAEFNQQNDRFKMWETSMKLFSESPIVGIGKNNWVIEYGKYGYNDYKHFISNTTSANRYIHPHSSIFSIISEQGILGVIIYISIGFMPLMHLFNQRHLLSKVEIAACMTLINYLLLSLIYGTVYNFYGNFKGMSILAIFALGIISQKGNKTQLNKKISKRSIYILLMCLSLGCFFYFFEKTSSVNNSKQARTETRINNLERAELLLCSATKILKDQEQLTQKSQLQLRLNKADKALQSIKYAHTLDPYNIAIIKSLAKVYYKMKNYEEAKLIAMKGISLKQNYYPLHILYTKSTYMHNPSDGNLNELFKLKKKIQGRAEFNYKFSRRDNKVFPKYNKRYKACESYIKEIELFVQKKETTNSN